MLVNKSVKVSLTDDEVECLERARELVEEIYKATSDYDCEVEFEDDVVADTLDDIQATIRNLI